MVEEKNSISIIFTIGAYIDVVYKRYNSSFLQLNYYTKLYSL